MDAATEIRCPKCGANDVQCVTSAGFGGRERRQYSCRRCGKSWSIMSYRPQPAQVAEYHYTRPELCGICNVPGKVASTRTGFRYVRCPQCGGSWKETGVEVPSQDRMGAYDAVR